MSLTIEGSEGCRRNRRRDHQPSKEQIEGRRSTRRSREQKKVDGFNRGSKKFLPLARRIPSPPRDPSPSDRTFDLRHLLRLIKKSPSISLGSLLRYFAALRLLRLCDFHHCPHRPIDLVLGVVEVWCHADAGARTIV